MQGGGQLTSHLKVWLWRVRCIRSSLYCQAKGGRDGSLAVGAHSWSESFSPAGRVGRKSEGLHQDGRTGLADTHWGWDALRISM